MPSIPNGVYPTMITPYTDDDKIDFGAVERLLNWYHQNNIKGVFAVCQSSEMWYLNFEERLELMKFIVENKPAGMTVVASGHTADDLDRQIYEANAFIDTGIDAYVFISNRFAGPEDSDDVLLKNLDYVVSRIPEIGLGIYECPYPYKRLLTPYVLKRLADSGRFQFLKDTCCDPAQIQEKLDAVRGSDLKIFNANAATLLETLEMGCAGFSGIMANFFPDLCAELCACYKTDPEKAKKLQDFIGFSSMAEAQAYPINCKYFHRLEGFDMCLNSRSQKMENFNINVRECTREMRNIGKLFRSCL